MALVSLASLDERGRITALRLFGVDDLETARAEYDRLTSPPDEPFANAAWRASQRFTDASNAGDWDAFAASLSPEFEFHERRANMTIDGMAIDAAGREARFIYRAMFDLLHEASHSGAQPWAWLWHEGHGETWRQITQFAVNHQADFTAALEA